MASRSPATRAIIRPTAVEPVKRDDGDARVLDERLPGLLAVALDDVEHARAAGPPRRRAARRRAPSRGVSSDAFSTAAFPQRSAGKTFHATFAIGVFAAMIRPATPSGWRSVIACRFGVALGIVLP